MGDRALMPDLASLFARHEKAILAFSGGKDSLLAVYQVMREAADGTAQVLGGVLGAEEEARAALVANLQAELQSDGEETTDAREVRADTAQA